MFERFTDSARRVVVLAQEEARMLNHNYIGTEHLVMALCRSGTELRGPEFAGVLPEVPMWQVQEYAAALAPRGEFPPGGHIPFTPAAKRVLEVSLRVSMRFGHNTIDWGHLLLAVLENDNGDHGLELLRMIVPDTAALAARVTELLNHGVLTGSGRPTGPGASRLDLLEQRVDELTTAVQELRARLDQSDPGQTG